MIFPFGFPLGAGEAAKFGEALLAGDLGHRAVELAQVFALV
jgi:hypothetical protein